MSNLTRYEQNGLELFIDVDGSVWASVKGYARMSGKDKSTISRRLQGVAQKHKKNAETLTRGGLQGVALISEDVIQDWIISDNPELAKSMMKMGLRIYLYHQVGYQISVKAPEPKTTTSETLRLLAQAATELANIQDYSENKPGVDRMVEAAKSDVPLSDDDFIPLCDLVEDWDTLTRGQKSKLGSIISRTYEWAFGHKPPVKYVTITRPDGSKMKGKIRCYPSSFHNQIISCRDNLK